jgi:hypothetical protein
LASPDTSGRAKALEFKAKLTDSGKVGMAGADAQPVTGDNVVKIRVAKPRVFQAEDLATGGVSGSFEVKGSVI